MSQRSPRRGCAGLTSCDDGCGAAVRCSAVRRGRARAEIRPGAGARAGSVWRGGADARRSAPSCGGLAGRCGPV